jgi:hypothetical protein
VAGAVVGGVLQLTGTVWREILLSHAPRGKNAKDAVGLLFYHHHAAVFVVSAAAVGAGAVAMALALRQLYAAAKFRRSQLPVVALYCVVVGPVLFLAGQTISSIVIGQKATDFAHLAHHTNAAARHLVTAGSVQVAAGAGLAGQLALGVGFVLISLNAMRTGLLTRFMGVLGILVGVLFVVPIGTPVPVVQAFWLLALGYLLSGRWPSGVPPAWASGREEPWPSQQELRERAAREGKGTGREPARAAREREEVAAAPAETASASDATEGVAIASPAPARTSGRKRKRKKRR